MPPVIESLLDSSTVLAFIRGEPHRLDEDLVLAGAGICSVNLAEVISVLLMKGVPDERITSAIGRLGLKVVPLDGFYSAEEYHQNFLARHPDHPYIVVNDLPKLARLKATYPQWWKA